MRIPSALTCDESALGHLRAPDAPTGVRRGDAPRRGAQGLAAKLHHIIVPEDAYSFIADDGAVAFVVKSGAIRIARDGITVRPLAEDA